jgi:hypothetical protein
VYPIEHEGNKVSCWICITQGKYISSLGNAFGNLVDKLLNALTALVSTRMYLVQSGVPGSGKKWTSHREVSLAGKVVAQM